MGMTRPHLFMTDWELIDEYVDWDSDTMRGIDLEVLKEKGWARLWVGGSPDIRAPYSKGNFPTPSGKCEFVATGAAEGNHVKPALRSGYTYFQQGSAIDPIPCYIPPYESVDSTPELAKKYPLAMVSGKAHAFLNSQYANEKLQKERQGEQIIIIHPNDANKRNLNSGEDVKIFNDRGSFSSIVEISEDIRPGVIYANVGYWDSMIKSQTGVNNVTDDRHTDMGESGAYSDILVQVEKM
jgi:anaerobic selenocysteine-containing dehydrogenase